MPNIYGCCDGWGLIIACRSSDYARRLLGWVGGAGDVVLVSSPGAEPRVSQIRHLTGAALSVTLGEWVR